MLGLVESDTEYSAYFLTRFKSPFLLFEAPTLDPACTPPPFKNFVSPPLFSVPPPVKVF